MKPTIRPLVCPRCERSCRDAVTLVDHLAYVHSDTTTGNLLALSERLHREGRIATKGRAFATGSALRYAANQIRKVYGWPEIPYLG